MNKSIDKDCKSIYIVDMKICFDKDKAAKVLEEHGVEMDDVRNEILEGRFAVDEVSNQAGHPGQRMFVVIVDGYACCAPYVVECDGTYFLKTAFKNRTYQRRYENGEFEIPV